MAKYALQRAHTAVVLFADHPSLASHYAGTIPPDIDPVARPDLGTAARSWIVHALPLVLARLLPPQLCHIIHPQLHAAIHAPPSSTNDPTLSPPPGEHWPRLLWRYVTGEE